MIQLSKRLEAMEESATLAMSRISRELRAAGKDIISLSLGEPDFHTPEFIKQAAIEGMQQNYTTYTPVAGYDDLRESIAEKFRRDNGIPYTKENIIVSTGAKQSIANVVMSCIDPGDEVIIPAPYWVSYVEIVKVAEGKPVVIAASIDTDFKITPAQLEAAITPKTKNDDLFIAVQPHRFGLYKEELGALAKVIARHPNLVVIADEIYEHINFQGGHYSLATFPEVFDQVVTVNGVSKAWSMTGWRLGYIGAPKVIADACNKIQGQFTSATCSITQRAAIAAMKADPAVLKDMIAAFHRRRDLVFLQAQSNARRKTNVPQGAFLRFPRYFLLFWKSYNGTTIHTANDLCLYLLSEGQVALVTGEGFGDDNCIRISYAASEETLTEAMNRIGTALAKLQ